MIKLLLLLFGAFKFSKIFLTGGTMLLSIGVYALIWGWPYAVGFVLLIFAHEMGHFLAAKQRGLNVGVPTFIPFVGAWINLREQPRDVETEAYVAFAGPFVGTLAALACYFYGRHGGGGLFLALAYAGFFLNLFNLIPVSPLDGGRITAILSPRIWLVGAPILVAFFVWQPSPLLILLALLAAPQIYKAWRGDHLEPGMAGYYQVSKSQRIQYGLCYLGLMVFLALMCHGVYGMIGSRVSLF